ncbi:MAG: hypothetical protein WC158_00855 [Candidatus Paceibacterota bacterium]
MKTPEQNFNTSNNPEKENETSIPANEFKSAEKPEQTIEQIKQTLLDPHVISKKHDQEKRKTITTEAVSRRRELQFLQSNILGRENTLAQIEEQSLTLNSLKAEKLLALEQKTEEVLVRIKSIFGIKDRATGEIKEDVNLLMAEIDQLSRQAEENRAELIRLREEQLTIPDSKKLLEAYYERMETIPLSNAEKRELLKKEVLEELSTEEYIALWRRLNPHFLSHVTRQGFRDHSAMVYHFAGLQEFHNGLVKVLEDGKMLRPPIALDNGLSARDKEAVRHFLELHVLKEKTEKEAKERLNKELNFTWAAAPHYPDKTAVHFAAQIVADNYYGGESNNEVFFLYPSDVLASQHDFAFNGWEKDFTKPQSETKWNDVFIWPSTLDNTGISADSGIVFLPENTPVDKETGSKYASELKIVEGEEKRVMIEDEKLISAFIKWAENLNQESSIVKSYKKCLEPKDYWKQKEALRTCLSVINQEILELGFDKETAARIAKEILNDGIGAFIARGKLDWGNLTPKEAAYVKLKSANANWEKARNTITAKEYWERYFEKHPEQKPKHIVYYNGDPTLAIHEFQRKYGIGQADTSASEGQLLGFDDKCVMNMVKDKRAWTGYDDLVEMSNKIISDYYRNANA